MGTVEGFEGAGDGWPRSVGKRPRLALRRQEIGGVGGGCRSSFASHGHLVAEAQLRRGAIERSRGSGSSRGRRHGVGEAAAGFLSVGGEPGRWEGRPCSRLAGKADVVGIQPVSVRVAT